MAAGLTRRSQPTDAKLALRFDDLPINEGRKAKLRIDRVFTFGDAARLDLPELQRRVGPRAAWTVLAALALQGIPLADGTFLQIPKDLDLDDVTIY